jgi:hypothetical protein
MLPKIFNRRKIIGVLHNLVAASGLDLHGLETRIAGSVPLLCLANVDFVEVVPPASLIAECLLNADNHDNVNASATIKQQWEDRHRMIDAESLPKLDKKNQKQSSPLRLCYFAGFCLCNAQGFHVRKFVDDVRARLRKALAPGSRHRMLYDNGLLVACLSVKDPNRESLATSEQWYLFTFGNLNHYRFQLLPLVEVTDEERIAGLPLRALDGETLGLRMLSHTKGQTLLGLGNLWQSFRHLDFQCVIDLGFWEVFRGRMPLRDTKVPGNLIGVHRAAPQSFDVDGLWKPKRSRRNLRVSASRPMVSDNLEDNDRIAEVGAVDDLDPNPADAALMPAPIDDVPCPGVRADLAFLAPLVDEGGLLGGELPSCSDSGVSDAGSAEFSCESGAEALAAWRASDRESSDGQDALPPAVPPAAAPDPPESHLAAPPPIPPAPPAAAGEAFARGRGGHGRGRGRAAGRGVGPKHPSWVADIRGDGLAELKFEASSQTITAHCNLPHHGKLCRMRRKVTGKKPIGFLLAWLSCGDHPDFIGIAEHQLEGRPPRMHISPHLTHEKRKEARDFGESPAQFAVLEELFFMEASVGGPEPANL